MKKIVLTLPLLAGMLWGSAGIFVRTLSDFGMDRFTILSSRMLVAAIIMFVGLILTKKTLLKIEWKDLWLFGGTGILGILGLNFCYNEAVGQVTLSLAAILLSLAPVFVIILSAVIFKEKITFRKVNCMILALIGCALASGIFESSGLQWSIYGIIMGFLSAFFCALYGIFSKIATNKGYHTFTIIFYSLLICSIVLFPFTDWNVFGLFLKTTPINNTIFAVLHSACTSILPYALYSLALLYMENGKVSILAGGGEPMAAVIFGVSFYSEIPTILNLTGLIITVIALSILCMPSDQVGVVRRMRLYLLKK